MIDIKEMIVQSVSEAIKKAGYEYSGDIGAILEQPSDSANGDLSLPCFKFASVFRTAPPKIALALKENAVFPSFIKKAENVGGYLNFYFDDSYYLDILDSISKDKDFGRSDTGKGKTVCIDYSSPNIAKRFHVGHLGTTVIGNAIKNILKFCSFDVVGINHLGDWGTQFGKLIVAYKLWSSEEKVKERGIDELVDLYVKFCAEAEKDASLNDEARKAFAKLETKDEEYMKIWQYFKEISLAEYKKTYDLLGITFDSWNGEAFYNDKMDAIVEELKAKGLLISDNGASIVRLDDYNMPPALILKSDGSTLYATRDITAAIWRKKNYDFYKCLYVTSAGQSLHFAQYFKVIELMGYDWAKDLVHIPYGTMSVGGEKLASRTGKVILLDDLFAEAIKKAKKIIEEKNADLPDKDKTAEAVGVGAVIFWALSNSRIKDSNFSWEESLSFDGNTGPYVQYTYARSASLLRKFDGDTDKAGKYEKGLLPEEKALIKTLSVFPCKVLAALNDYEPFIISRYALEVCSAFNVFYHNCGILRAEEDEKLFRMKLVKSVYGILGKCLDLLTIKRTETI